MKLKGDLQVTGTLFPGIPVGESGGGDLFPRPSKLTFNRNDGFYLTPDSTGNPVVNLSGDGSGTITGGASLGGTEPIFASNAAPTINFKGLTAGAGISLGSTSSAVTVTNTGPTLSQIGPGFYGIGVIQSNNTKGYSGINTLSFEVANFYLKRSTTDRDKVQINLRPPTETRGITKVYKSANQSIPASTQTVVTFDIEIRDDKNWHSNTVNPERIVVTESGAYLVSFNVAWVAAGGTQRQSNIMLNGNYEIINLVVQDATNALYFPTTGVVFCSAGDYLTVQVRQDSVGSIEIYGTLGNSSLTVVKL